VDAATFQAFEMYALQHRDAAEVAEVLGLSREQLYVAKSRCLKMLRAIAADYERLDGELRLDV
jgi:DNA-directed RNA polymerase specialized sigma24 family protein